MNYIDALVLVILLAAAWSGLRRGLISSGTSLIGAVGGAVLGVVVAPWLMGRVDQPAAKIALGMAVIIAGVGVGEIAGSTLGRALSERVTWSPARTVDRGLGLVGQTIAIAIVVWLVAVPLASVPYPWLASAVRSSTLLRGIDQVMPTGMQKVSDRMRSLIDSSGFPAILDPLTPTPDPAVDAPDPQAPSSAGAQQASRSVFKIIARAPSCERRLEGSGFIIGPQRMLTNAHVVAGATSVTVTEGIRTLTADVVEYDSERDLAVLDVPGLTGTPLTFASAKASSGTSTVAIGYPLDGPLTLTASRIGDEISLRGPDIYDRSTVVRDVYTIRGTIRPGNSGGPLVDTAGQVLGVVFGASLDRPGVGFVLTAAEAAPVVADASSEDTPVSTGACTTD